MIMIVDRTVQCPVCDGEGLETIETICPQSYSRDVGEIYEELRHCERCNGAGEVTMEDDDDDEDME
jgi:DnaJ-class molecular chaperone